MESNSLIGKNIKEARMAKKWSQMDLANKSGYPNTLISSYENGKRNPSLDTLADIASALGVSIDQLYYGNGNVSFLTEKGDKGNKIVNSICMLMSQGVIENVVDKDGRTYLCLDYKYSSPIKRLIKTLKEFMDQFQTYSDPKAYLTQIKDSVANQINE